MLIALAAVTACGSFRQETGKITAEALYEEAPVMHVTAKEERTSDVMDAVVGSDGTTTAFDILDPAYVSSSYKHVPERFGMAKLEFSVTIPEGMAAADRQIRIVPVMEVLGRTQRLDSILVTGTDFTDAQDRGYDRFRRYMERVAFLSDSERLLYRRSLEIFLERYAAAPFGTSEEEAVEHYTRKWLRRYGIYMQARAGYKKDRFIPEPRITGGIFKDTAVSGEIGRITMKYGCQVKTGPGIKSVGIILESSGHKGGKVLFRHTADDTVRFMISSLSSLADTQTRYVRRISKRDSVISVTCRMRFGLDSHTPDMKDSVNIREKERIAEILVSAVSDSTSVIDSIIVTGTCSPEGRWEYNRKLSAKRAGSLTGIIMEIIENHRESRSRILHTAPFGAHSSEHTANNMSSSASVTPIGYGAGEDWEGFEKAVRKYFGATPGADSILMAAAEPDPDKRERGLMGTRYAATIRDSIYPLMRKAVIDIHIHRPDAISDTVVTTTVDSTYMKGIAFLQDRDYRKALELLSGYKDYNSALCYLLMEYNHTAAAILESAEQTPERDYLLAVAYARTGRNDMARKCLEKAVAAKPSLTYRKKLDPECSVL